MSWNDLEQKSKGTQEKIPYTKFEIGATTIRVLDTEPYSFWQHWLPNINSSAICPGKDHDCPICQVIAAQKQNPDMPKKYSSTQRHALRVWNYNTNQMEIMIQGNNFFKQLFTFFKEVGPLTGYDLKIVRSGNGKETNYTIIPQPQSEFKLSDKVSEVDLSELLKPADPMDILKLMDGKTWNEIIEEKNKNSEGGFTEVVEDIPFA